MIIDKIIFFWGIGSKAKIQKGCFSQWWPCRFEIDGQMYNCAEQYMMAMKAKAFNDAETFSKILTSNSPKEIKALGRLVKGFNPAVWNKIKFSVVIKGNYAKFSQNPELKDFLLSTGDAAIAEASPKDMIWGIGLAEDDPRAQNPETWKGENLLGKAIMEVRKMLRSGGFQAEYDVILEDYIISDNFHNRYWSRAQNFKANKPNDFSNVSIMNPLFMSLHPARTIWYARDKGDWYVAVLELNPSKKICDLTDPEDIKTLGLPMPIVKMFQEVEPYFSFTSKINLPKDTELVPDQLKLATFVLKGLAAHANVHGRLSVPELLTNSKKAENVFSEYDKLLGSVVNENAILYPIYVGLKEFVKTPKMTQSKAYVSLANEYANKLDKIFNGNVTKLNRHESEIFSEIRAYLDAFRNLTENTDNAANSLDVNIIKATYIEGLQELLHRRIADCGYCGYYCREKFRLRQFSDPLNKKYKSLCLFDTSAIVSVKTMKRTTFEEAYDKLRAKKYTDSIKGVKDSVYEDILAFYDDYFNKKFDYGFDATVICNNRKTLPIRNLVVKMTQQEVQNDNVVCKIVKERILKWMQSHRDKTPIFAKTSTIKPVQNAALNAALFTVVDHPEITVKF